MLNLDPNFQPNFKKVDNVDEVADLINLPHEDYPLKVVPTKNAILEMSESILEMFETIENVDPKGCNLINMFDIKSIHSHIMKNLSSRGQWRTMNVSVGQYEPPSPWQIQTLMDKIVPISGNIDISDWYNDFQCIHPFEDGNGRTGGVVYTVVKYIQTGEWWTPCQ